MSKVCSSNFLEQCTIQCTHVQFMDVQKCYLWVVPMYIAETYDRPIDKPCRFHNCSWCQCVLLQTHDYNAGWTVHRYSMCQVMLASRFVHVLPQLSVCIPFISEMIEYASFVTLRLIIIVIPQCFNSVNLYDIVHNCPVVKLKGIQHHSLVAHHALVIQGVPIKTLP